MANNEMTILEAFEAIHDGAVAHIGAENGSAFFFVGTKEEYNKTIDEISIGIQIDNKRRLHSNEAAVKRLKNEKDILQYEFDKFKDDDLKSISRKREIRLLIQNIENDIAKKQSTIENLKNAIDTFVPIRERKIIRIYQRLQNDGIVVIVPGVELGKLWFYGDNTKYY